MTIGTRELLESAFAGWFISVAAISLVTGTITRSAASVAYAFVMLAVAALEFYDVAHGAIGGKLLGGALVAIYLSCAVGFAFTLLRTMEYAPRLGRAALAALCVVLLLIALGCVWPDWSRFYIVDRLALAALLVMLGVLGARAVFHEATAVPAVYICALFGPVLGMMLWTGFAFDWGVLWESLFFACAVALRNHGVERQRDQFAQLAAHDGLTGVANRRIFDQRLAYTWAIARRTKISVAIMIIDIDHFKRVNDTHGHPYGDECLRRVARLCAASFRRTEDTFARYGGEEFAAILVNTTMPKAVAFADMLRRAVEAHCGVTVSIGVAAQTPGHDADPATLLKAADAALYKAKSDGRNRVSPTVLFAAPLA